MLLADITLLKYRHGELELTFGGMFLIAVILIFILVLVDYEMDRFKGKQD